MLFADVSGGARLRQRLGGAETLHAVERCVRRMERSVAAHGGRLFKAGGEEIAAVFPTADAAIAAACEMQRRVADLPPASGVELGLRVGVQSGRVLEDGEEILGEPCTVAARLVGAARAGQVLTTAATLSVVSPALRARVSDLAGAGVPSQDGLLFEVNWQSGSGPVQPARVSRPAAQDWVLVRYRGTEAVLDDRCTEITFGRDLKNHVIVLDKRASRNHARIERRPGAFYLVDDSTNGTFVTFSGEPEIMLSHEEIPLRGGGRLCFGHSAQEGGEAAEFEVR